MVVVVFLIIAAIFIIGLSGQYFKEAHPHFVFEKWNYVGSTGCNIVTK